MSLLYYIVKFIFFSIKGGFQINMGSRSACTYTAWTLLTQHFYPSDVLTSRVKQIKVFIVLTASYNLLHSGASTSSPPTILLHSLLFFTHSLASWMVIPLTFKLSFTPSIYILLGLPLPLLPSIVHIRSLAPLPPLFRCANHRMTAAFSLSPKPLWSPWVKEGKEGCFIILKMRVSNTLLKYFTS